MAGETIIRGRVGIISIYDTVASAYRPIACLTSNSMSTTLSMLESITKCDPGKTVRQGDNFSYELSMDGEYIDTTSVGSETTLASHDYLLQQQMAINTITWKYDTGLTDTTYYGQAIITGANLDQSADANSTFSATFSGSGDIVTTDPTV